MRAPTGLQVDQRRAAFAPDADGADAPGAARRLHAHALDQGGVGVQFFVADRGHGARCAAHFAMSHMTGFRDLTFMAGDGLHTARPDGPGRTEVSIRDVPEIKDAPDGILVNTGVPHLVVFTRDCGITDVVKRGRKLRRSPVYAPAGVNVNFVTAVKGKLHVRTYERGVEDETLACGTGITASAIAAARTGKIVTSSSETANGNVVTCATEVITRGGFLSVRFTLTQKEATDIFLAGPATFVFSGEIVI